MAFMNSVIFLCFYYERESKQGGGVMVYINSKFTTSAVGGVKIDKRVESVWLDIKNNSGQTFRVAGYYRAPNQTAEVDKLMIDEINRGFSTNLGCRLLILGDFNLPDIDWEVLDGLSAKSEMFIDCCLDNFLTQYVSVPTCGNSILDLVLAHEIIPEAVEIGESLGNSDHNSISFRLNFSSVKPINKEKVPNFNKGNYDLFREKLARVNWEQALNGRDVYDMWDTFKSILDKVQRECIPYREIRGPYNKVKPVWLNRCIRSKIIEKRKAFKKFKRDGSMLSLNSYRVIRNDLNKAIKESKRVIEINLAKNCRKDSKRFFSFYKNNSKDRVGPLEVEGEIVEKDEKMVEVLNNYFSSVFTNENDFEVILADSAKNGELRMPEEFGLNIEEIRQAILGMSVSKAAGPDQIYSRVLHEGVDYFAKIFYLIFNRSLSFCEIPLDWKEANVVPLFKKGDKKEVSNYRPVSLTSLVGKILEKVIKNRICDFLEKNGLIMDSQHGFRTGRSCLTNLLSFFEYVTRKLDEASDVDIIYLDFSKAFDTVPHRRLLYKLRQIGVSEVIADWVENWLYGRTQRVVLNGHKSSWKSVGSGVPQGSVLGPLLFIIYVNDLELGLKSKVWKFADDTKIASEVNTDSGAISLQRDIDRLVGWVDKWKMKFNSDKCKVMHIGHSNKEFGYSVEGDWLQEVEEERDLGVIVSKDMKFHKQCLEARNKASRMLGMINRNVSYKSKDVIMKLYDAYVRPHLEYCIQAWAPYHVQDIEMLEKVQRRATKLIPGLRDLDYGDRLKELNAFSVRRRVLRGDMIHLFLMLNCQGAGEFKNWFEIVSGSRTRGHKQKIRKHNFRLDVRKYFFSQRVINFWNRLPEEVINSSTLNIFKGRLDAFMTQEGIL